jgi:hypothetical protein
MERWQEELELVGEEMRRALQYTIWKAGWWREQAVRRDSPGCYNYALRQADYWLRYGRRLAQCWTPALNKLGYIAVTSTFPVKLPAPAGSDNIHVPARLV